MPKKKYYVHGGALYTDEVFADGLYTAPVKQKIPNKKPEFKWMGGMIPMQVHQQIISFFQDGYKKTKSENLIWLYHCIEDGSWLAWAPPQECNGMTVSATTNSKAYKEQRKEIPERYVLLGTYHHHCQGKAFASDTDKDDEQDREGLHVTIGGIGSKDGNELSIHARATFNETNYETYLGQWIEDPDWLPEVPESMQDMIYHKCLTMPNPGEPYPEQWLKNAEKKIYNQVVVPRTQSAQQSFPEWNGQSTTTGKNSNASGDTYQNYLTEEEEKITKALSDYCASEKMHYVDQRDIVVIMFVLLNLGYSPEEANEAFEAAANPQKSNKYKDALLGCYDELTKEFLAVTITRGRAQYLFKNYDFALIYKGAGIEEIIANTELALEQDVGVVTT